MNSRQKTKNKPKLNLQKGSFLALSIPMDPTVNIKRFHSTFLHNKREKSKFCVERKVRNRIKARRILRFELDLEAEYISKIEFTEQRKDAESKTCIVDTNLNNDVILEKYFFELVGQNSLTI